MKIELNLDQEEIEQRAKENSDFYHQDAESFRLSGEPEESYYW